MVEHSPSLHDALYSVLYQQIVPLSSCLNIGTIQVFSK